MQALLDAHQGREEELVAKVMRKYVAAEGTARAGGVGSPMAPEPEPEPGVARELDFVGDGGVRPRLPEGVPGGAMIDDGDFLEQERRARVGEVSPPPPPPPEVVSPTSSPPPPTPRSVRCDT